MKTYSTLKRDKTYLLTGVKWVLEMTWSSNYKKTFQPNLKALVSFRIKVLLMSTATISKSYWLTNSAGAK